MILPKPQYTVADKAPLWQRGVHFAVLGILAVIILSIAISVLPVVILLYAAYLIALRHETPKYVTTEHKPREEEKLDENVLSVDRYLVRLDPRRRRRAPRHRGR